MPHGLRKRRGRRPRIAAFPPVDANEPAQGSRRAGSNFLRQIIERDLAEGTYAARRFAGTPGDAAHHAGAPADPARIRTRFPPEPNGYLHIGHAKSICLNFGLARGLRRHLPPALRRHQPGEGRAGVRRRDHRRGALARLRLERARAGARRNGTSHLYFASDYFDFMYRAAEALVDAGLAYVDEQSAERDARQPRRLRPRRHRQPVPRPHARPRTWRACAQMKAGELADGAAVLRAKIDMASPNINLRDPALYRIKRATHHNTGDRWCIYPMYTYAHPIEDALENITHSICTLEFEDQRPFYDWLLDTLCDARPAGPAAAAPVRVRAPQRHLRHHQQAQAEAAGRREDRRRLGRSAHADDRRPAPPRLHAGGDPPDVRAHRRQQGRRLDRLRQPRRSPCATTSSQGAARDGGARSGRARARPTGPRTSAPRRIASPARRRCTRSGPSSAQRDFELGPALWIERDDFAEVPPKGFFRLFPATGCASSTATSSSARAARRTPTARSSAVLRDDRPDTRAARRAPTRSRSRARSPGSRVDDAVPPRCACTTACSPSPARRRRQGLQGQPEPGEQARRRRLRRAVARAARAGDRFQFERHGYFVADRVDHGPARPVFNRIATLRDTWSR